MGLLKKEITVNHLEINYNKKKRVRTQVRTTDNWPNTKPVPEPEPRAHNGVLGVGMGATKSLV